MSEKYSVKSDAQFNLDMAKEIFQVEVPTDVHIRAVGLCTFGQSLSPFYFPQTFKTFSEFVIATHSKMLSRDE